MDKLYLSTTINNKSSGNKYPEQEIYNAIPATKKRTSTLYARKRQSSIAEYICQFSIGEAMMHTLMAISGKTLIDSMKFGSVDENSLVYLAFLKVIVKNQVHPVWTISNSLTVEVFAWYHAMHEMNHKDVHVSVQGSFASTEWSSYLVAHEIIWHTAHPGVREIAERNKSAFLNGSSKKTFPAEKLAFPADLIPQK